MKRSHNIYIALILTFLLSTVSAFAQCSIDNFTVITSNCIDENTIEVTVDFDSDTPSAIGYQLVTTLDFVVLQYSDFPYTLTIDPNCVTDYTIGVVDLSVTDCEVSQNIGVLCCEFECSIEVEVAAFECSDDLTSIIANLDINLEGSFEDSIDIYTNNNFISTVALANASAIELPSADPVLELIVCEQNNTMCCDTLDLVDPCFCNIFDITAAVSDCDPIMESYFLRIDFETTSLSSDSFNVGRLGNPLGRYAYTDLPVRVGPIGFEDNDDDIFILDQFDAFCFGFIPHTTLDSCDAISCEFSNLEVFADIDCENNGEATLEVSFNTSVESQGFLIEVNEETFGPFAYGQSVYSIGPISSESLGQFDVEVVDIENENCNISTSVIPISCDCSFDNLNTIQFCNADSLIAILIDFDPKDAVSDSFDLISASSTFRYAYVDLPINVTGLPTEDIELEIVDAINGNCSLSIMESLECVLECAITNFEVEVISCNSFGNLDLAFSFDYEDLSTQSLVLRYNGDILDFYTINEDSSAYTYSQLEVDCDIDFNSFSLAPINDPDCGADFVFTDISCCSVCDISNLNTNVNCVDETTVEISIDFDYDGPSTNIIDIYFENELFLSGTEDELFFPSITTNLPQAGDYTILVQTQNCEASDTISIDCTPIDEEEECFVENVVIDSIACDEGLFTAILNFDYQSEKDSFVILINNFPYDTSNLEELPLEIGPFNGNGFTEYDFSIFILNEDSCTGEFDLGTIDCEPNAIDENILSQIKWSTLPSGILVEGISTFNEWTLYDINGRKIQQNSISEDQFYIDSNDRTTGLYFIRLQDQDGNIHSIKIIL